jgi:hypothetical protein
MSSVIINALQNSGSSHFDQSRSDFALGAAIIEQHTVLFSFQRLSWANADAIEPV